MTIPARLYICDKIFYIIIAYCITVFKQVLKILFNSTQTNRIRVGCHTLNVLKWMLGNYASWKLVVDIFLHHWAQTIRSEMIVPLETPISVFLNSSMEQLNSATARKYLTVWCNECHLVVTIHDNWQFPNISQAKSSNLWIGADSSFSSTCLQPGTFRRRKIWWVRSMYRVY